MTPSRADAFRWLLPIAILLVLLAWHSQMPMSRLPELESAPSARFPPDYVTHRTVQVRHLAKRLTDDEFRTIWAARGCKLMSYMEEGNLQRLYETMSNEGALSPAQLRLGTSQSVFTNYDDLASNGWTRNPDPSFPDRLDFTERRADVAILDVFADLGISATVRKSDNPNGDNERVVWDQDQDFFNGAFGVSTEASYAIIYNTRNGMIIRQNVKSPEKAREEEYEGENWQGSPGLQLPDLRLVSDVISLEYAALCRKHDHRSMDLRYTMDFEINNPHTSDIINTVLSRKGYTERDKWGFLIAKPWSQRVIIDRTNEADLENFQGLVGSPNARGTAWMLVQHPDLFGHKRIRRISIWKPVDDYYYLPCLTIELEDVPVGV